MYEWDNNRKQKNNERQKSIDEIYKKENTHKPKINKRSQKLAVIKLQKNINKVSKTNNIINNIKISNKESLFERLYKDDVLKRKEKQLILNQIYSPTFTPKIIKYINNSGNRDLEYHNDKKVNKSNSIN